MFPQPPLLPSYHLFQSRFISVSVPSKSLLVPYAVLSCMLCFSSFGETPDWPSKTPVSPLSIDSHVRAPLANEHLYNCLECSLCVFCCSLIQFKHQTVTCSAELFCRPFFPYLIVYCVHVTGLWWDAPFHLPSFAIFAVVFFMCLTNKSGVLTSALPLGSYVYFLGARTLYRLPALQHIVVPFPVCLMWCTINCTVR